MRQSSFAGALFFFLVFLSAFSASALDSPYKDTLWVPVIFYDYWVDNNLTNPDFESATASNTPGMVAVTLGQQRKPVPTEAACPTPNPNPPSACHLAEWFRVSGLGGSDATCLFQCDSITNPIVPRWFWTTATGTPLTSYRGRIGEFIGPNHDSTYNMRNVIIYDSLPFRHLGRTNPDLLGVYEYDNSSFFPLDNRGYGIQPTGSGHNFGFTMELHTTFRYRRGLTFNFRGDDDVWAFVNNQRVMDLGGRHGPTDGAFNLNDIAGLQVDSSYAFDFFYAERHTTGSNIRITTNIITPEISELKLTVTDDTICAGVRTTIKGTVIDQFGRVMEQESDSILWTIDPATRRPGDTVFIPRGDSTIVTGTVAWRGFNVIATFRTLSDTAFIYVKACTPAKVDIIQQSATPLTEAQLLAALNLWAATPRLTVYFDSSQTRMYVYAALRDVYNNFVDLARTAGWASQFTDTATVIGTTGKLFEGVIDRTAGARTGSTFIFSSTTPYTPDTAIAVLRTDRLIALRLVNVLQPIVALDTIRMNTDQSMTIQVQGIWSTAPGQWVDVTGLWSMTPPNVLQSTIPLPTTETGRWQYDPINSGTAILTVVNGTATVNVPVIITEAPPSRLTLTLVTHPDSCFAGVPIKIAATIFNGDGQVDGIWDGSSVYSDILNNALRAYLPWLTVNNRAIPDSLDKTLPERFTNGTDTILLVLYYAPLSDDSLHQIRLALSGSPSGVLNAQTNRFKLKPGPIDSIQIEDQNGRSIETIIQLSSPNGSVQLFVSGFDAYGNRIIPGSAGGTPLLTTVWRTDSTLHRLPDSIGSNIIYLTNTVVYPEAGRMWAVLVVNGDTLRDFVPIVISAPKVTVSTVTTRDVNGNGFIDRLEVKFNKKVDLTAADLGVFRMQYPTTLDQTTSGRQTGAVAITRLGDSLYAIDFTELSNPAHPQTAWKPYLAIGENNLELTTGLTPAADGCPPVVWKVTNHLNKDNDHSKDTIVVDFSEAIVGSDGAAFSVNQQPYLTFNCWTRNPDGTFTPVDAMFEQIPGFNRPISRDSTVYFLMTNGNYLFDQHWVNIKTSPSVVLKDKVPVANVPTEINQKVQVGLHGNYPTIQIIPNPAYGTLDRQVEIGGGTISSIHVPQARDWVKRDGAGTVIAVSNIRVPSGYDPNISTTVPKGYVKIYDVVGNTVNYIEVPNWLAGTDLKSSQGITVDLYWTGANAKSMLVAAGVYRVVAYVDYPASQKDLSDKRLIAKAGILR